MYRVFQQYVESREWTQPSSFPLLLLAESSVFVRKHFIALYILKHRGQSSKLKKCEISTLINSLCSVMVVEVIKKEQ